MGGTPQGPYGKPPSGQPAPMQEGDFTPAVRNRKIDFATCEIDPPSAAYVDVDDTIILGTIQPLDTKAVNATIRILRPHGAIETVFLQLTPGFAGTLYTVSQQLLEGYILSAGITLTSNTALLGPCYAWLTLRRFGAGLGNLTRTLISGNLQLNRAISWPERQALSPTEEALQILTFSIGNPAAGVDITYSVPVAMRLTLFVFGAQLVTSATAGTRTATLEILFGGNVVAAIDATATQAPSLTRHYTGYGNGFAGGSGGTNIYWPLPSPTVLAGSMQLVTSTANLSATDQWSNVWIMAGMQADLF